MTAKTTTGRKKATTTRKTTSRARKTPESAEVRGVHEEDVTEQQLLSMLLEEPVLYAVEITGDSPILFHRYNIEDVNMKASAKKGSDIKKTDNPEAYIWRNADGLICLPFEYFKQSMAIAGKKFKDPSSSGGRKSAMDLINAIIVNGGPDDLSPIVTHNNEMAKTWDSLDTRRCVVQRAAVQRARPRFAAGWRARFVVQVQDPQYMERQFLARIIASAGRFVGVADFRPNYGRYTLTACRGVEPHQVGGFLENIL